MRCYILPRTPDQNPWGHLVWFGPLPSYKGIPDCWEKYQQPQICRWFDSTGRKWRGTKESLDESERGEWKNWLKTTLKAKIIASGPITSWQIEGGIVETMADFIFWVSKITADGDCSHEIKTLVPWKERYNKSRQWIKKQRHHFANKGQSYGFSSSQDHVRAGP